MELTGVKAVHSVCFLVRIVISDASLSASSPSSFPSERVQVLVSKGYYLYMPPPNGRLLMDQSQKNYTGWFPW